MDFFHEGKMEVLQESVNPHTLQKAFAFLPSVPSLFSLQKYNTKEIDKFFSILKISLQRLMNNRNLRNTVLGKRFLLTLVLFQISNNVCFFLDSY